MPKKKGDPRSAELTIELDRPRTLRLDMNALADIEEILDVSLFELAEEGEKAAANIFSNLTMRKLRDIAWAMLRAHDPELTKEDVGRILDPSHLAEIVEAFGELFQRAMPEAPDEGPLAGGKGKAKAKADD